MNINFHFIKGIFNNLIKNHFSKIQYILYNYINNINLIFIYSFFNLLRQLKRNAYKNIYIKLYFIRYFIFKIYIENNRNIIMIISFKIFYIIY